MGRKITAMLFTLVLSFSYNLTAQTSFNISNRTTGDTLVTVDDQGRVGIGTTSPGANLEVKSDAPENGAFISVGNSDDTNYLLMYGGRGGASSLSPGVYWGDTSPLRFVSFDGAYNELMRLSELGNLGIGIDDPFAKLDLQMSGTGPWQRGIRLLNPDLDIGNRLLLTIGKYDTPFNAANIYFNFQGEDSDQNRLSLGLFNVSDVLNIIGTGQVGIGTTDPSGGLEVTDTIYASSGGFRFPDGSVQTSAAGGGGTAGNTLDGAYDQGGPGNGRIIIADSGAFEVNGIDGVNFSGTLGSGTIPAEGGGTRMMWYPGKAAFRAGGVIGTWWNDNSIGNYSVALGYGSRANGISSVALCASSIASGTSSFATGSNSRAYGDYATAMGFSTEASGVRATSMGYSTTAGGAVSTAIGSHTTASGDYSLAMGQGIEAQGSHSVAIALSDQTGQQVLRDSIMAVMGGKVGIGTPDPVAKLEIRSEPNEPPLVLSSNAYGNHIPFLRFQGYGGYDLLSLTSDDPSNIFLGIGTGQNNTVGGDAGTGNLFFGIYAGYSNTSGYGNTIAGALGLFSNTTGDFNTALGYLALQYNTTASANTAIGTGALGVTNTGGLNTAIGHQASVSNTTGQRNVSIGIGANRYNQQGSYNTMIGSDAGRGTTAHNKSGNVFIGNNAGYYETGDNNLYIENSRSSTPLIYGEFDNDLFIVNGGVALTDTFGIGIIPMEGAGSRLMWYPGKAAFRGGRVTGTEWDDENIGDYSTALGYNTIASGGEGTVAMGYNSVARGNGALVSGFSNVINNSYSFAAGRFCTTAQAHSVALGSHAKARHLASMVFSATSSGTLSDSIYTGGVEQMVFRADGGIYFTNGGGAAPYNTSRLINTSTGAYLSTGGAWTNASSRDFKENISALPLQEAINAVNKLNPVTYNYKADREENYVGFIAEDVPEIAATKDRKGLSTMDIVALLTKVVQNQQSEIELLKKKLNELEK